MQKTTKMLAKSKWIFGTRNGQRVIHSSGRSQFILVALLYWSLVIRHIY